MIHILTFKYFDSLRNNQGTIFYFKWCRQPSVLYSFWQSWVLITFDGKGHRTTGKYSGFLIKKKKILFAFCIRMPGVHCCPLLVVMVAGEVEPLVSSSSSRLLDTRLLHSLCLSVTVVPLDWVGSPPLLLLEWFWPAGGGFLAPNGGWGSQKGLVMACSPIWVTRK